MLRRKSLSLATNVEWYGARVGARVVKKHYDIWVEDSERKSSIAQPANQN
jgi:hypothetical protein